MTKEEINRIHSRGLAVKDKRYFDDEGNVYIGFENGRLKLLDKATNTTFKQSVEIQENNVQDAIESLKEDIEILETKVDNNFIITNITINEAIEEAKCFSVAMSLIL